MNQFKVLMNGKNWYILWLEDDEWNARTATPIEAAGVGTQLAQNRLKEQHTAAISACDGAHLVDEARTAINS